MARSAIHKRGRRGASAVKGGVYGLEARVRSRGACTVEARVRSRLHEITMWIQVHNNKSLGDMKLVALKPLLIVFDGATTAYVLGQGHAKCQYKKYLQYNNKPFGDVNSDLF